MDAGPPPPPGGGGGGAGGSGSGGAPRGKGEDEASGSGAAANEVVPVFGGDAYTQLFMLIMLLLGLFKARGPRPVAALRGAALRCSVREPKCGHDARAAAAAAPPPPLARAARVARAALTRGTPRGAPCAQASTQRCTC
jgi:hypothetical protein